MTCFARGRNQCKRYYEIEVIQEQSAIIDFSDHFTSADMGIFHRANSPSPLLRYKIDIFIQSVSTILNLFRGRYWQVSNKIISSKRVSIFYLRTKTPVLNSFTSHMTLTTLFSHIRYENIFFIFTNLIIEYPRCLAWPPCCRVRNNRLCKYR